MVKRKRTDVSPPASPAASPQAGPSSQPTRPVTPLKRDKSPRIIWQLSDGPGRWKKESAILGDLNRTLPKVLRKLGLPDSEPVRLHHAREIGRMVDIHDDFDFQSLKARAEATKKDQVVFVRVGAYDSHGSPWSSRSAYTPAPEAYLWPTQSPAPVSVFSAGKGKRKRSPSPDISSSPQTVLPPAVSPTLPASADSPSEPPKKKKKKKKKPLEADEIPAPATPTPQTPAPINKTLSLAQKYKPVKSSPLATTTSEEQRQPSLPKAKKKAQGNKKDIGTGQQSVDADRTGQVEQTGTSRQNPQSTAVVSETGSRKTKAFTSGPGIPSSAEPPRQTPKVKSKSKAKGKEPPLPPTLGPADSSTSSEPSTPVPTNAEHAAPSDTPDARPSNSTPGHETRSSQAPASAQANPQSSAKVVARTATPLMTTKMMAEHGPPAADVLATIMGLRSPETPLTELPVPAIPASLVAPGATSAAPIADDTPGKGKQKTKKSSNAAAGAAAAEANPASDETEDPTGIREQVSVVPGAEETPGKGKKKTKKSSKAAAGSAPPEVLPASDQPEQDTGVQKQTVMPPSAAVVKDTFKMGDGPSAESSPQVTPAPKKRGRPPKQKPIQSSEATTDAQDVARTPAAEISVNATTEKPPRKKPGPKPKLKTALGAQTPSSADETALQGDGAVPVSQPAEVPQDEAATIEARSASDKKATPAKNNGSPAKPLQRKTATRPSEYKTVQVDPKAPQTTRKLASVDDRPDDSDYSDSDSSVPDRLNDLITPICRPDSPRSFSSVARIHRLAMRSARRPGSHDGLSVSDAVIETGSSSSESGSDSSSDSSASGSGSSSDESDGNDTEVQAGTASASKRPQSARDSAAALDLSSFLSRPLTPAEAKRVQQEAASLQLLGDEVDGDVELEEVDTESISDDSPPLPRQRADQREDSVVGSFATESEDDETEETVDPPSQILPTILAADSEIQHTPSDRAAEGRDDTSVRKEVSPPTLPKVGSSQAGPSSSRSFRALNRTSATRDLDDSPGAKALQDGMNEEKTPQPSPHLDLPDISSVSWKANGLGGSVSQASQDEAEAEAEEGLLVDDAHATPVKPQRRGRKPKALAPAAEVTDAPPSSQKSQAPPSPAQSTGSSRSRQSRSGRLPLAPLVAATPLEPINEDAPVDDHDIRSPQPVILEPESPMAASRGGTPASDPTRRRSLRSRSGASASVSPLTASRRLNAATSRSSQIDELADSSPRLSEERLEDASETKTPRGKRQSASQTSRPHSQESPLFMTQPSSQLKTQAYPSEFEAMPVESQTLSSVVNGTSARAQQPRAPVTGSRSGRTRSAARSTASPPRLPAAGVPAMDAEDGETSTDFHSDSNVPDSLLSLHQGLPSPLPAPRRPAAPSASFTSLSQLPKDFLHAGRDMFSSASGTVGTASGVNGQQRLVGKLRNESDVRNGSLGIGSQRSPAESESDGSSDSDSESEAGEPAVNGTQGSQGQGRWAGDFWKKRISGLTSKVLEKGW